MDDLNKSVLDLMLKNRRQTQGFQYTVPSPESYPYQWLWDSCFHAIILSHFSIEDAKKELLSLVSKQFENGMIPHMIYWQKDVKTNFPVIQWGKEDTSSITQPPMLAYAVWQIYQKEQGKQFLELMYPALKKFYNYFLTSRDPRANHLAGIINPDESGEDNSPRFDQALNLPPNHQRTQNDKQRLELVKQNQACNFDAPFCMKNFFWVKYVPFNAILVENLHNLSDIAIALGYEKEADLYFLHARLIVDAMRKLMLEDGIFWSTMGADYQKIKVKTWAIFAPMFAKIASQKEADMLINDYLLNPAEFNLDFLVPTVSKAEPSFDPQGFWRGPVWASTNWFVYQGLLNYGAKDVAQKVLDSSLKLLEKSGFREQFNPQTGEGLGAKDFTWGGLVVDMLQPKPDQQSK